MSLRDIEIHGIPMDLGVHLRGVDMGPTALRIAGLQKALESLGHQVRDQAPFPIVSRVEMEKDESTAKYLKPIAEISHRLHELAYNSKGRGKVPIFLGGDHSIAMGTAAGISSYYRDKGEKVGLIWFDAHTDMNTPDTSPSGNIHGMPLAALMGFGPPELSVSNAEGAAFDPDNVYHLGARDVDRSERSVVTRSGIHTFSMKDIDMIGMAKATQLAIEGACKGTAGFHLSFDIDGLDPEVAPGVGTPVRGGINYREAHLFMELIADSGKLLSMDVVELNPILDRRNQTAEVVVHLIQSAFGRRIL